MKISKAIEISSPVDFVYKAYADLQCWKKALDDVVDVKIYYDDSFHQEFDMTVRRGDKQETVHSVRFCFPCSSIEMFQTQPPPAFKSMSGVWKFTSHKGGCLVQASRNFEIKQDSNFDSNILEKFLEKNLTSFKIWIEKTCKK